jgi:hypothetical protein
MKAAALLLALAAVTAVALVLGQAPFPASRFEYGVERNYEGVIEDWPYPMLVARGERYLLVAPGKHGFDPAGYAGRRVRLRASLIQRGADRMLQVTPESVEDLGAAHHSPAAVDLGPVRLTGEIVDSKCYLGVMNPGSGKVHRDCAVRCISGGAPPAFIAKDASGDARVLLLAGSNGRVLNREVLDYIAEPLTIEGRLMRRGESMILLAEPRGFRPAAATAPRTASEEQSPPR